MKYELSYSTNEHDSIIENYRSFFKWLKRIVQLLRQGHSVLIYKPTR